MILRCGVAVGLAVIALSTIACANVFPSNELVLRPGDRLVAQTPQGILRVDALSEAKRHYTWPNVDRTLELDGRPGPWLGAQGAYVVAGLFNDTNAEENSYDFANERALEYYLQAFPPTAYGSDGTSLSFGTAPNGSNTVTIEKLCVDHRPPTGLRTSPGSSFSWTHGDSKRPLTASYECARKIFDPVAYDESWLRQDFDGTRESNFWNTPGGSCELLGPSRSEAPPVAIAQTLALRSGAAFSLHNVNGSLEVEATSADTRVLRWHNVQTGSEPFELDTAPREMTVDLAGGAIETGAAGAIACRRVSGATGYTVTYGEGVVNFASVGDFLAWMGWGDHGPLYLDDSYGSAAVLGGFRVGQSYGSNPMLAVDIVRICIGGAPASNLPGANNTEVRLELPEPPAGWSCPPGTFDVADGYQYAQRHDELGTLRERRLRAYLHI